VACRLLAEARLSCATSTHPSESNSARVCMQRRGQAGGQASQACRPSPEATSGPRHGGECPAHSATRLGACPRRSAPPAAQPEPHNQSRTTRAAQPEPHNKSRTTRAAQPEPHNQRRTTSAAQPAREQVRRTQTHTGAVYVSSQRASLNAGRGEGGSLQYSLDNIERPRRKQEKATDRARKGSFDSAATCRKLSAATRAPPPGVAPLARAGVSSLRVPTIRLIW